MITHVHRCVCVTRLVFCRRCGDDRCLTCAPAPELDVAGLLRLAIELQGGRDEAMHEIVVALDVYINERGKDS